MARSMTEDAVRDLAREALGLVDSEIARAGVGQLTTFNQLGFPGVADKPDGWYLPNNKNEVAVVFVFVATFGAVVFFLKFLVILPFKLFKAPLEIAEPTPLIAAFVKTPVVVTLPVSAYS